MTGISQVAFPNRADGSQPTAGRRALASRLIGTAFPIAAGSTGFSNRGPNSAVGRFFFRDQLAAYMALEGRFDPGLTKADVPVDAVTTSASGVDPHISKANAAIQAHRIAAVRHLPLARVDQLIADHTDGRFLGVIGEPGVNVLELNLALDKEAPAR